MPYIGKQPTVGNFQVCDAISVVNGQAAYTMQVNSTNVEPETANHMLVSLNGVLQKPGSSFTISGSTITFASNLATGDVIDFVQILGNVLDLGTPSDDTVTAAKLNNDIISGQTALTAEPDDTDEFLVSDAGTIKRIDYSLIKAQGGLAMADQFRLSADRSANTNEDITTNLERVDTDGFGQLGTGMTESSGIFTFPSTGIYYIELTIAFSIAGDNAANVSIYTTTDGSNYDDAAIVSSGNQSGGANNFTVSNRFIFDVTNTSTHKFKLVSHSIGGGSYVMGETDRNRSSVTIFKLGDT